MKPTTMLLIGAAVVGGVVLASNAAAKPGAGGEDIPNLQILESQFALMAAGPALLDYIEADGELVAAVWTTATRLAVIDAMKSAAVANPTLRFVAAPVDIVLPLVPADLPYQIPPDPQWGTAAVRDGTMAFERVSSSQDSTAVIADAIAMATGAAGGLVPDASTGIAAEPLTAWLLSALAASLPPIPPLQPPNGRPPVEPPRPPRPEPGDGDGSVGPTEPADPAGPGVGPGPGPSGPGSGGSVGGIGTPPTVTENRFVYPFQSWNWTVSVRRRQDLRWDWWIQPPSTNVPVLTGVEPTQARAEAKAIERIKKWDSPASWVSTIGDGKYTLHVRRSGTSTWSWWVTTAQINTPLRRGEASSATKAREAAQVAAYQIATAGG